MTAFDDALSHHLNDLGCRLELITPADKPSMALVSNHAEWMLVTESNVELISASEASELLARDVVLPELKDALVISQASGPGPTGWVTGRAGMRYRDLIPGRLGGRFIASHIEVCDGGPVPDLVHHHAIRFQMIFCHRGWVDVVYEDQGEPFRMNAGDCVLQPPDMRHKVLASSAGSHVVEIGCPASHDTLFDYELELPNDRIDRDRRWSGQQFVRHIADDAEWKPARHNGFDMRDTGIAAATDGLASVRVLRPSDGAPTAGFDDPGHDGEFWFVFVLDGSAHFTAGDQSVALAAGDAVTVPAGQAWAMTEASADLRLLEVVL